MTLPLSIFTIVFQQAQFIEFNVRESLRQAEFVSVVEGATNRERRELGNGIQITGKPDSTDGTIEVLKRLQFEFPKRLRVQFANGRFWRDKTTMVSRALLHVKAGLLLQKDADEFWFDWQIKLLRHAMIDGGFSDAEFYCRHFWASDKWHVAMKKGLWGGGDPWRRAWLWNGEGVESHEPPRFRRRWENLLERDETRALGLVFFHASYSDFDNVRQKERFYGLKPGELTTPMMAWLKAGCPNPGPPGPMTRYDGPYPPDWPKIKPWI